MPHDWPKQTQKRGVTPAELNAKVGRPDATGTLVSGGQLEHFQQGWAMLIFANSRVAHWYRRFEFERIGLDRANTLCDAGATGFTQHLFGPGNYPRCQSCINTMTKLIRAGKM